MPPTRPAARRYSSGSASSRSQCSRGDRCDRTRACPAMARIPTSPPPLRRPSRTRTGTSAGRRESWSGRGPPHGSCPHGEAGREGAASSTPLPFELVNRPELPLPLFRRFALSLLCAFLLLPILLPVILLL